MRPALLVEALLLATLAAGAFAQVGGGQVPFSGQIINLSLLEVLVAIDATELAGIFTFIPEERTSMAMADYLVHNHKALKKFIKKAEKDVKDVHVINEWDRQVVLFMIGINAAGVLPPGMKPIPQGWMNRINELALVQPSPLQVIVQKRREGR